MTLDLDDSTESGVKNNATEGLKEEAEVGGSVLDPAGAQQDETDDYSPPSNLAEALDMFGMPNHASLARWLRDHNDQSGLRTVAREGLDKDAEDNAEGIFKLGVILYEEGNLPTAERAFRMAIQGQPTDPDPYLYLGKMGEESGNVLGAEKVYRRANAVAPAFAEAFKNFVGADLYARYPSLRHNPEYPSRSGGGATH